MRDEKETPTGLPGAIKAIDDSSDDSLDHLTADAWNHNHEACAKNARMLGNVELALYGYDSTPEATRALKSMIARSEKLTGKLFIGYPPKTGAVLISDKGQTTVIDLSDGPPRPTTGTGRTASSRPWTGTSG